MKMPRKIPGNVRNKEGSVDLHYTEKRQKNNDAVKKSREKTRQKAKETMEKVTELKQVRNIFLFTLAKVLDQCFFCRRTKCLRRGSSCWRRSWHFWKTSSWPTQAQPMASLWTTWRSRAYLRTMRWSSPAKWNHPLTHVFFRTWWVDQNIEICIWLLQIETQCHARTILWQE